MITQADIDKFRCDFKSSDTTSEFFTVYLSLISLAEQLLREREAYRQVAMSFIQIEISGGLVIDKDAKRKYQGITVDAEAERLLKKKQI